MYDFYYFYHLAASYRKATMQESELNMLIKGLRQTPAAQIPGFLIEMPPCLILANCKPHKPRSGIDLAKI